MAIGIQGAAEKTDYMTLGVNKGVVGIMKESSDFNVVNSVYEEARSDLDGVGIIKRTKGERVDATITRVDALSQNRGSVNELIQAFIKDSGLSPISFAASLRGMFKKDEIDRMSDAKKRDNNRVDPSSYEAD